MDRPGFRCRPVRDHRSVAKQIEHSSQRSFAHRHRHGGPSIDGIHAANEPVGRTQGHTTNPITAKVLLHFAGEANAHTLDFAVDFQAL